MLDKTRQLCVHELVAKMCSIFLHTRAPEANTAAGGHWIRLYLPLWYCWCNFLNLGFGLVFVHCHKHEPVCVFGSELRQ